MADQHTIQALLRQVVDDAVGTLASSDDRRGAGDREGQYALDLLVDGPMVQSLLDAGLGVLSEEAGVVEAERSRVAIIDPVDGSTNASRGIPWFNTSICVVDDDGPLAAIVENHVTRERFEAYRGAGATHNGRPMVPAGHIPFTEAIVGVNGLPTEPIGSAQFRALGASALDISYVASGGLDAYIDFADEAHGVWDYLGAHLVCTELDVYIEDVFDRPLVHRDHEARRTPAVARDRETLEIVKELRRGRR